MIPFYQRDSGILSRSLLSVCRQTISENNFVHIFIIDDSSPLSPESEVNNIHFPVHIGYSIHKQENGGPGSARNLGLQLSEKGNFDAVAFLDSDDEWLENHIAEAIDAINQGYDFYFCDNTRTGIHDRYSDGIECFKKERFSLKDKSSYFSKKIPAMGFDGGAILSEMISECLCQTSTVVMRLEKFKGLRFDIELRAAGEDHLFWINSLANGARVFISFKINVVCGSGVNIYYSAFAWDNPATLKRVGNQTLMFEKLLKSIIINSNDRKNINKLRFKSGRAYGFLFYRSFLRGKWPSPEMACKISKFDRYFFFKMPYYFLSVILNRKSNSKIW